MRRDPSMSFCACAYATHGTHYFKPLETPRDGNLCIISSSISHSFLNSHLLLSLPMQIDPWPLHSYQTPFSYCLHKWNLSQLSPVFSRLNKSNLKTNSLQVMFCETSYQSCCPPPDFLQSLHLYLKSGVWIWGLVFSSTMRTPIQRVFLISLSIPSIFLATASHGRFRLELVLYQLPWHRARTLTWFLMCFFFHYVLPFST